MGNTVILNIIRFSPFSPENPLFNTGLSSSFLPAMEELDGDEVRVSSRGRLAERDIVQVLFRILFNLAGKGCCIFLSTRQMGWGALLTHDGKFDSCNIHLPFIGGGGSEGNPGLTSQHAVQVRGKVEIQISESISKSHKTLVTRPQCNIYCHVFKKTDSKK